MTRRPILLAGFCALLVAAGPSHPPAETAAVDWLRSHAFDIAPLSANGGSTERGRIAQIFAGARIVGAGEATHGSREIFQTKVELFRLLVEQQGFTALAIEANFAEAERLNAYVHGGPGDIEQLTYDMGFWTWDTEEVRALIEWMRDYNSSHGNRLSFYGIDIQFAPSNLALAIDYLERFAPAEAQRFDVFADYRAQATDITAGYRLTAAYPADVLNRLQQESESLFRAFEDNRATLEAASGRAEFLKGRAAALAAAWYFMMEAPSAGRRFRNFRFGYDIRDRAMADLAEAALEREGEESRLFVWAHNVHVSEARHIDERMTMGQFLADTFGTAYVSLGFAFDRGSFQAMPPSDPARPDARRVLTEMSVPAAPPDHSEAVLRRVADNDYIADLRQLDAGRPEYGWFHARRPLRWTGANYSTQLMALHPPTSLTQSYDVLIFLHETTRARPLRGTRERYGLPATR